MTESFSKHAAKNKVKTPSASNPVAANIRALRNSHQLTQKELSDLAHIPRATLAHIESDSGNPSLKSVIKVAEALGVSIKELVEKDIKKSTVTYIKQQDMSVTSQNDKKYSSKLLSPVNAPYIRISSMHMEAGCHTRGLPHPKGSNEFFHCLSGSASLVVDGEKVDVSAGDLIYFPGHLPHYYSNKGKIAVEAISVVTHFEKSRKVKSEKEPSKKAREN